MCNECDCENYDLCSIVGSIPLGFCCPKCVHFNEAHICLNSKAKTEQSMSSKAKNIEALRKAFAKEKSIENFP